MSLLALKYEDAISSKPPRIQGSDTSSIRSSERVSYKQPPVHLRKEDAFGEAPQPDDSLVALRYEHTVARARPSMKRTTVAADAGPRRLKSKRHMTVCNARYQDLRPSTPPVIGTEPAAAGFRNFSRPSYCFSPEPEILQPSNRWSTSSSCYDDIIDDYSYHAETTPSEDSRDSFLSSEKTGFTTPTFTEGGMSFDYDFPFPDDRPATELKRYVHPEFQPRSWLPHDQVLI